MQENFILTRICHAYINFIINETKINSNRYRLKDGTSCFGFIPWDTSLGLIRDLRTIRTRLCKKGNRTPKFIDIGCGIGNILLPAAKIGYNCTGLEFNLKTCRVAKKICKHVPNIEIIKGDMRKFDRYHEYDVLYYYQPMITYSEMVSFSIKLAKQMKPGAYIICHGASEGFKRSKSFYKLKKKPIWRKKPIRNKRRKTCF